MTTSARSSVVIEQLPYKRQAVGSNPTGRTKIKLKSSTPLSGMSDKHCSGCEQTKPEEEFHWKVKAKGIRRGTCKTCRMKYCKAHYTNNYHQYIKSHDKRLTKLYEKLHLYKEATPCLGCGNRFPYYVMEFDHLRDKQHTVSRMVRKGFGWSSILAEIKKCELVCSNCHKIRTYERMKHRLRISPVSTFQ